MAITRTAWIDDDGTGTTGTVINNAEKTLLYDQIDAAILAGVGGIWTNVVYAAGDFTVSPSGTWTGPAPGTYAYALSGKTMIFALGMAGRTISGAPVYLHIKLPAGAVMARSMGGPFSYSQAGVGGTGYWLTNAGQGTLYLSRDYTGTPWPAGANALDGTFILNIQ